MVLWEGGADPAGWLCTATAYGPSGSSTWRVPMESVVFLAWGSPTARPYHGLGPTAWAADSARLSANAERALADEAGGPVAQLLPVPQDETLPRRRVTPCWLKPLREAGARAEPRRPNLIGGNLALARCRPTHW